ncbi:MAG: phosphoenolpyruvate--protein phosphotransferase [Candidatus Omnitrophica bacterium]|nr:phosphoenolpyruvate--protein phosphotransferase [Candidatus Omnitrophota bacterium]
MEQLKGIPVSPGIAIGEVHVWQAEEAFNVSLRYVQEEDIPKEITRFEDALTRTRAEILDIRKKIARQIGRESSDIFNAHLMILEDRTLIEDVIALIKGKKIICECAFATVIQRYFTAFSQIDDEYLRERISDIKDVGRRLLKNLYGEKGAPPKFKQKGIVVAHDLSPSDTAMMDKDKVIAFITEIGGPTSHTAILGQSMEIPVVVGLDHVTSKITTGDTIIVDGTHGIIIISPDKETIEEYARLQKRFTDRITQLDEKLRDLPAETTDGHRIHVAANIEFHDELPSVISHGADGIGLYRTEYIYMNRLDLPSEEEQFQAYRQVVEKMDPQPVVIRTLDLGGDKFLSSLDVAREMNPFLGWRAIRFCLTRVDVFKVQLRAILRASVYGRLKIMYPMISNVYELRRANEILEECGAELKKEGLPFNPDMEIGAMIEIPSAAIISEILAKEVQFFSIGTNDLIQYCLAVDRVNEKIAYLYEPTHPAIIKLIKLVVDNGHAQNRWVGTCGEMSADPAIAILLTGLGIDEISTSPFVLPKVKKAIRSVSYQDCKRIADRALTFQTGEEVRKFLDEELKRIASDLVEE